MSVGKRKVVYDDFPFFSGINKLYILKTKRVLFELNSCYNKYGVNIKDIIGCFTEIRQFSFDG